MGANLKSHQQQTQVEIGRFMHLKIPQCPLLLTLAECKIMMLSCTCDFSKVEATPCLEALSYTNNSISFKRSCLKSCPILQVCCCPDGKARLHPECVNT